MSVAPEHVIRKILSKLKLPSQAIQAILFAVPKSTQPRNQRSLNQTHEKVNDNKEQLQHVTRHPVFPQ